MTQFHILFSGEVVAGADAEQVQGNLALELGISAQKAKQLFSGRTVVLRSQLNADEADAFVAKMSDLGAVCRMKNYAPAPSNPARYKLDERSPDKTLRDLTAAHVECPRCGNVQLLAEHCSRCGVDIALEQKKRKKEDAIIEKKIKALRERNQPKPVKAPPPPPVVEEDKGRKSSWFRKAR